VTEKLFIFPVRRPMFVALFFQMSAIA